MFVQILIVRPQLRMERNEIFFLNVIVTKKSSLRRPTIPVADVSHGPLKEKKIELCKLGLI